MVSPVWCPVQEISKLVEGGVLAPDLIPLARDVDDNFIVIDASENGKEGVYEWSEERGSQLASSLGSFLEQFRDDLLSGGFEFVDEIGVVEKVKKGHK
jgi:hypothetical protein